jgi:hypothetical protein
MFRLPASEINERRSATLDVPSGMTLQERASELVSRPFVVVKTPMAPDAVGEVVGSIEPASRIETTTITERMTARNLSESFRTQLLAGFAGIALLLAGVGVYTVLSHLVGHRTREFGVRMALGASRGNVFGQVFRRVLPPAAIGMMIGLGAAPRTQGQSRGLHVRDPAGGRADLHRRRLSTGVRDPGGLCRSRPPHEPAGPDGGAPA